jgi:HEAT repeat protein
MMGMYDKSGYQLAQSALENPDALLREFYGDKHAIMDVERSSQQQIAALALGRMGNEQALPVLQPFLQERDAAVRVAAAMATLQLLASQPLREEAPDGATPSTEEETPTSPKKTPHIQSSGGLDELDAK